MGDDDLKAGLDGFHAKIKAGILPSNEEVAAFNEDCSRKSAEFKRRMAAFREGHIAWLKQYRPPEELQDFLRTFDEPSANELTRRFIESVHCVIQCQNDRTYLADQIAASCLLWKIRKRREVLADIDRPKLLQ
jgi:hypothetical protein